MTAWQHDEVSDTHDFRFQGLSDEEFRDELRDRQGRGSWTGRHWAELERRGLEILECDPDLQSAVLARRQHLLVGNTSGVAAVAEQLRRSAARFAALVPQLPDGYTFPNLPNFKLDLPAADLSRLAQLSPDALVGDDLASDFHRWNDETRQREAEDKRVALEGHRAEAEQRDLLREMANTDRERYDELIRTTRASAQPRLATWLNVGLAAVAALGAILALL